MLLLIHSPYSHWISCLNHISFLSLFFLFQGHPLHLAVMLIGVNSSSSLCVSWTWHFWQVLASYFVEWCGSNSVLLLFPPCQFQVIIFGKITQRVMLCLPLSITWGGSQYPVSHCEGHFSPLVFIHWWVFDFIIPFKLHQLAQSHWLPCLLVPAILWAVSSFLALHTLCSSHIFSPLAMNQPPHQGVCFLLIENGI